MKGGECFMNGKIIKAFGFGASIVSVVATLVGNWAAEKQQKATIIEEVAKAVAEATKGS